MKTEILDIKGNKKEIIELPKCFSKEIRDDLILKVLETKKTEHPYSPSPVAGKQHAAKGKVVHRRHVWRSGYGRGMSRVPRKVMSRRGSQFGWEAAEVPHAKGGMRAHPPKVISRINTKKINKKELQKAFESALGATITKEKILLKYPSIKTIKNFPLIVESKILSLKVKDLCSSLKNILGEDLNKIALKNKKIRSGKGKARGRKYKKSAGLLIVTGNKEKLKTKIVDSISVKKLGVLHLAKGGPGRLTMYTDTAIKELSGDKK